MARLRTTSAGERGPAPGAHAEGAGLGAHDHEAPEDDDWLAEAVEQLLQQAAAGANSRVKSGKGLPEAYFLRSYVHSVEDRDTEALKDLRKVLELDPDGEYGTRAGYIIDLVKQE